MQSLKPVVGSDHFLILRQLDQGCGLTVEEVKQILELRLSRAEPELRLGAERVEAILRRKWQATRISILSRRRTFAHSEMTINGR